MYPCSDLPKSWCERIGFISVAGNQTEKGHLFLKKRTKHFSPEFSPSHWTLCKELLTLNQRQSSACQKTFCLLSPRRRRRHITRITMILLQRLSAFPSKVNACLLSEASRKVQKCFKGLVWTSRGQELHYQQRGLLRDLRDTQGPEMQLPLPIPQTESRMGADMAI